MERRVRKAGWPSRTEDNEDRDRWRQASAREKGDALIDLLGLVDAIGRFPERTLRWPGFARRPQSRVEGEG